MRVDQMRGVVFRVGQGVWRSLVPLSIQQRRGRAAEDKRILNGDIDTHRAIFVHIPKAAGSAVGVALYGHDRPGHFPITRYQGLLGNAINDYLTFTFVRHPEDRFISAYNYLLDKPKNPSDVDFAHNVLKRFQSIDEFIANYLTEKTLFSHVHFYPQTHFIQSDGNLNIDFIGRYENLQEDFGKLCAILNLDARLEQMNVTKEKAASNLSAPSQDKLRFLYRNDYEFLGYE